MNTCKLLVSILLSVCASLSACAPVATSIPTAMPSIPTTISLTPTSVPTPAQTTISPKIFKIPMSVSFDSDWLPSSSSAETVTLAYRPADLLVDFIIVDNNVTVLVNGDPPTRLPFPDDFAGYLQSNSYFSEVTPTVPVSLGGATGYQVEAIGKSSSPVRTRFLSFGTRDFTETVYPEPQKFRFVYFGDISGKRLLIVIGSLYGTLPIAQFDALMPKVQEVLDTVTFNK
jgi:hypothetical protein